MSTTNDGRNADKVQRRASLHENAVQAIAKGEVVPVATKTRKAPQKRSQAVHTHIVVDSRVMREAKLLTMFGSYTKIEIIDAETVIVR
jgi:hypothetical protein